MPPRPGTTRSPRSTSRAARCCAGSLRANRATDWDLRLSGFVFFGVDSRLSSTAWGRGTMRSMVEGHARCFLPYLRRTTTPVPRHHTTGGPPPRPGADRQLTVGHGYSHVPYVSNDGE